MHAGATNHPGQTGENDRGNYPLPEVDGLLYALLKRSDCPLSAEELSDLRGRFSGKVVRLFERMLAANIRSQRPRIHTHRAPLSHSGAQTIQPDKRAANLAETAKQQGQFSPASGNRDVQGAERNASVRTVGKGVSAENLGRFRKRRKRK